MLVDTIVEVLGTALLASVGYGIVWASKTSARIAVVEEKQRSFDDWLEKIERKLDRVIEHRLR